MPKFSDTATFIPNSAFTTGDTLVGVDASTGNNHAVLKENLLVNSSDLTFLNGKGIYAGTTINNLAYFGSYDTDGNVNVAHITAVSANSPYALLSPTCFFTAGASLGAFTGYLTANQTPVGNVGGGTDDLISYTLPANQLNVTGRGVKYYGDGYTANNANAKTIQASVGGTLVGTALSLTTSVQDIWTAEIFIRRTGTNTQLVTGFLQKNGGTMARIYNTVLGLTESSTIVVKMVCTGIADNDIVQGASRVEYK